MQTLTVDMFVSVDGWASGATSPGYFGYFGPELEEWITTELRLMTFPLIVGDSGREPFFTNMASAALELVDHRTLDGRVLLVEYRPTGSDIPRA